ncbi:unknown [Acetobacter sp. CAG:977]|nr:unknown [Acetobacter sp. CAG:977]
MDSFSRQNLKKLFALLEENSPSVFTDLDKTSCIEGNTAYAAENAKEINVSGCYMQPDLRRAFTDIKGNGGNVYIVTGRHWADKRENDLTGEKMPDGAFHDLLGGAKEFESFNAVAGHGRLLIKDGKTTVLRRDANEENTLKEQKFERYVGERVLDLKKEMFKQWPQMRGIIRAEYKKHLSYVDISEFVKRDPQEGQKALAFIDAQMKNIIEGKNPDGTKNPSAPENPDNAMIYAVEPTGAMEIRSKNQSKRNGVEKSGFLEEAYAKGGPVLVMGDSLGKNGTDRDMVEAVRGFFKAKNAEDRVFIFHVMNGEQNRITNKNDSCHPDISVKNPDELGQVMKMVAGRAKAKTNAAALTKAILLSSSRSI